MRIQTQDTFHGPALLQIIQHPAFEDVKLDEAHGHYVVNTNRRLFVKYTGGDGERWRFTFTPADLQQLAEDFTTGPAFLVLVCGFETICALPADEVETLLDFTETSKTQWLVCEAPAGKSISCSGSNGALTKKIPHNRYPKIIFDGE